MCYYAVINGSIKVNEKTKTNVIKTWSRLRRIIRRDALSIMSDVGDFYDGDDEEDDVDDNADEAAAEEPKTVLPTTVSDAVAYFDDEHRRTVLNKFLNVCSSVVVETPCSSHPIACSVLGSIVPKVMMNMSEYAANSPEESVTKITNLALEHLADCISPEAIKLIIALAGLQCMESTKAAFHEHVDSEGIQLCNAITGILGNHDIRVLSFRYAMFGICTAGTMFSVLFFVFTVRT